MHARTDSTSPVEAPLVAVVIPVYNAASTLAHTVQSVTNQTYRNLEIVLVDDGSSDASPEIAQQLAEQDARIRVIRQANQGVAGARNNGARCCEGRLHRVPGQRRSLAPDQDRETDVDPDRARPRLRLRLRAVPDHRNR
jgi:glycosyltransferase involved in cell wall biosynthesis